jgi:arylsulfatase A
MKQDTPNIIYILADDMGYGDMGCNNPESKIPTPNLDDLAAKGMRFTDAHAASSLCTPSRYNVLTGRYSWRTRLKRGIVWEWDSSLIEPGRLTVAHLLKQRGYATHCIGKWHLGWDWTTVDGDLAGPQLPFGEQNREIQQQRVDMGRRIDYAHRIDGGPVDRGFDSYFGVDVPNFQPYTWFENAQVMVAPTIMKPDSMYGHPGLMTPDWSLNAVVPELTRRAVSVIREAKEPFFLYFPLTSPHAPIVPNEQFRGMSNAGKYGDFVCEVDWVVGEVMKALIAAGKADNTLLIFTSDNGPEAAACDYEGAYELARTTGHYSMGQWRGTKRDIWEGGHREPFIAYWPGAISAGTVCDQLVCLGDFMATCADITHTTLPPDAGEDSVSMLPLLQGQTNRPTRSHLLHHSGSGRFAIRSKDWVLIDAPSGGDFPEPEWFKTERSYRGHDYPGELFRLSTDCTEKENLYGKHPEVVEELSRLLENAKQDAGRASGPSVNAHFEAE